MLARQSGGTYRCHPSTRFLSVGSSGSRCGYSGRFCAHRSRSPLQLRRGTRPRVAWTLLPRSACSLPAILLSRVAEGLCPWPAMAHGEPWGREQVDLLVKAGIRWEIRCRWRLAHLFLHPVARARHRQVEVLGQIGKRRRARVELSGVDGRWLGPNALEQFTSGDGSY